MAVSSAFRPSRRAGTATLTALTALLLGACGGGSGSGGSGSSQAPANQAPTAAFTLSVAEGFAPLAVSVDASPSRDPDGTISSYLWTFGDDAEAAGARATHTYTDTGTFSVRLEVIDDQGRSATAVRSVRVRGATVSGTIRIAAGSAVDSDVNDRLTSPVGNNAFATAQAIPAPLRLGGFVNTPGSGAEDGNFAVTGDPDDFYFVTLDGDEQILLSIGDPSADLDLELYSDASPPELLDASVSVDATEDLTAPAPGNYFVRVLAVSGASNYVLGIEPRDLSGTAGALLRPVRTAKRLSDPFVAGELLLAGDPAAGGRPFGRFALEPRTGHLRLRRLSHTPGAAGPDHNRRLPAIPDVRAAEGAVMSPAQRRRYRTLQAVRELARAAPDAAAEVNVLRRAQRQPDDEFYSLQWHYGAISLEQAWDLTTGQEPGSPEVVVAVVDTGVLLGHPDLTDRLLRDDDGRVVGFDFIQDSDRANDGDGIDGNPDDPGDDAGGDGRGSFHGTHVAGTVAADSDNGIGVAGVSWGARIMPMRALGIDGGTTFDVMQAVRYAAGLPNVSGTVPPVRADIINLSLGSDFYSEAEQRTLNEVRAEGVFLVASAGNGATSVPNYPASYDGVVSVSASTRAGARAGYSNFGPFVDVAAPGGDGADPVLSTLGEGGDGDIEFGAGYLAGTSMAAPHVAGVIALMKALDPALTPAQFDAMLQSDALTDDAGPAGRDDTFGWGIINANKAVQAAIGSAGGAVGAVLSVSTGTLNYQSFTRELDFSVSNLGSAPVTVAVEVEVPWLTVAAVDVDADGLGVYRASVDRSALADGPHQTEIRVQPDDPTVTARSITAALMVTSADVDADAGQHYVILVSPDENDSLAAEIVNAVDGEYTYTLRDVPPGEYRLFAGTDLDDDNFICDGGEACGAYPDLSSPQVLHVDAREQPELSDRSFSSEFRTTATTTAGPPPAGPETADAERRHGLPVAAKTRAAPPPVRTRPGARP